MRSSRFALPLISFLCAPIFASCGGDDGESNTGDGDGDPVGDGDGDTGGDGDGDNTGDGDGDNTGDGGNTGNPTSLSDALATAESSCESNYLNAILDYGEIKADPTRGVNRLLQTATDSGMSVRGEYEDLTGSPGFLSFEWSGDAATGVVISGQIKDGRGVPLVCFTGQAQRRVIDGQTYYVWGADMFALANEDGSCPVAISTPGLSYGCLSTEAY